MHQEIEYSIGIVTVAKVEKAVYENRQCPDKLNTLLRPQNNFDISFQYPPTLMIVNNKLKQQQNLKYLINMNDYHQPKNKQYDYQPTRQEKKCFREYEKEKREKGQKDNKKNQRKHDRSNAQFSEDQFVSTSAPSFSCIPPQIPIQTVAKPEIKRGITFNDLAYYPKGSLLSLKTCNIEIPSKKYGRVDIEVEILTEQQHKTLISQLFDPGFSLLSIKKDKNQAQIIQYLNQSKKNYRFVVCWLETVQPNQNEILREIAKETNEKQRIFGWHNDHIKIHIMSLRQLSMIDRFSIPTKFGSKPAAASLKDERVVMIVQYPQRIYEIKDLYHPFSSISRKKQEIAEQTIQNIPEALMTNAKEPETETETQIQKKQYIPEGNEPRLPFQSEKMQVVYEGWDDVVANQPSIDKQPIDNSNNAYMNDLPQKILKIKIHFGIKTMEVILSDEQKEPKQQRDLATELLNSLTDNGRKPSPSPVCQAPMQQNQYPQGCPQQYGYYDYYQPQYYYPPMDNRWNCPIMPQEYQSVGHQQYNHNGNYSYPPQYVQPNKQMTNPHINEGYWAPQQEGTYYKAPQGSLSRPEQNYYGGYQY